MNPQMIGGMKVCITTDHPRMTLSAKVPVTDEFRAEINEWMLQFFGVQNTLEDGRVISDVRKSTLWMNPRTLQSVRAALSSNGNPKGEAK